MKRKTSLLPKDAPVTQYLGLGDAVYFYTVAAPNENQSKVLLQRIQEIEWGLRTRIEYIEAAMALAEGRRADALSIAQARLERIGAEGGSAQTQLERELLIRCRDRAS